MDERRTTVSTRTILVSAIVVGGCILLAIQIASRFAHAQSAFNVLDSHFGQHNGKSLSVSETDKFALLLSSRGGRVLMRRLADEHETVVYDGAGAVYFVHERWNSTNSCIGSVLVHSGRETIAGHSSVPHQYQLTRLKLEGDIVIIEGKLSSAEKDVRLVRRMGREPGETIEMVVRLNGLGSRRIKFGDMKLQ